MGVLDTIGGLFRRPASLTPEAPAALVAVAPPTEAESVPGGGNLGGRLLYEPNQALRDAAGYGRAGTYQVGEWQNIALSNPYVQMAMDHVLRPVATARVDIEPPSKSVIGTGKGRISQADADLHTEYVRWALTEHFQLGRLSKVAAAGFLLSGFSLFEPIAEEVDCPVVPGRTVWALKDVPQCLPNSLDPSSPWRVDDTGRLVGIAQLGGVGMSGQWKRSVLGAERALLLSWKRAAGNFAGESQLRTCWYFASKVMPVLGKMVGVTLQREGPGIPQAIATDLTAKLTPGQREELVVAFANMQAHEASGLVMPAGWRTEWTFSPVSNKGHILDIYERMGMYILQCFGAQQLALGTNGTGSRSVGEVHDARSMAMVTDVLDFLVENYNGARGEADGLVKRLVDWTFGPQPAYPRVKLTPQRPEMGPKELAEAAGLAQTAGLLTPTLADQNALRERLALPPITPEEYDELNGAGGATILDGKQSAAAIDLMQRVADSQLPAEAAVEALSAFYNVPHERAQALLDTLKGFKSTPKPVPPAFGKPPVPTSAQPLEPDGDETDGKEPPGLEEKSPLEASYRRSTWTPWRPLTAAEEKMDLPALDAYFSDQRDAFEAKARPIVLGMLAKAAPAIHAAMSDGKVTPAEVAAIPLDATRLKAFLAEYVAQVRAAGAKSVRTEMAHAKPLTAAEDEQDDKGKSDADVAHEEADEVTAAQVDALARKVQARLRGELEREAVDALRTGDDAAEVVDRIVSRQIDTGAFRSDAGSVTTKAFNVGRDEAARIMGGIASVTYTAILDNNTCSACEDMDGEEADFNSPEHDAMVPPNRDCAGGDSCRCLLVMNPAEPGDAGGSPADDGSNE